MSLTESIYSIPATTSEELRAEQYGDFIENVLGITNKGETYISKNISITPYWLDENKTCGIAVVYATSNYTGVRLTPISGKGDIYSAGSVSSNHTKEETLYYQISKGGSVIYLRTSINSYRMLFAKDELDCWSGFFADGMYCQSGVISITNGTPANGSTFFSAVKMPSIVSEKMFAELYKVLAATSFVDANTIVNFNGQPYKFVSVVVGTSNVYPCFAFPVE